MYDESEDDEAARDGIFEEICDYLNDIAPREPALARRRATAHVMDSGRTKQRRHRTMNKRIRLKTIKRYADDRTVYTKLTQEGKRVCDRWDRLCCRITKEIIAELKAEETALKDAEADRAIYFSEFMQEKMASAQVAKKGGGSDERNHRMRE